MMLRDVSALATAYAADCKPERIRGLRSKKLLNGFGGRIGKGHLYTLSEIARLAIATILARHGVPIRHGFAMVSERERAIDGLLYIANDRTRPDHVLTIAVAPDRTCEIVECLPSDQVPTPHTHAVTVRINASLLLRSVIDRLNEYQKRRILSNPAHVPK